MNDSEPMVKVTELEGFYASGDFECFCFDRVESPWDDKRGWEIQGEQRVYPDYLIPDGSRGKFGSWRITVEFAERPAGGRAGRETA